MKVIIEDGYLSDLASNYPNTTDKRKFPIDVEKKFVARINQLGAANNENDLRAIKSLHFEKLKGGRQDRYSIRVNKGWRIIFRMGDDGYIKILFVEELSNHYGD